MKQVLTVTFTALALAQLAACAPAPADDPTSVKVGLLLPFTGASAASSGNFERAALFARDQINVGGVKGRHLQVVSADTHSDPARARESVKALLAEGVTVVIGPESAEIAAELKPMLDANDVVFLSPLVGAADEDAVDCTTPWFRLAPSARSLGEALAKQAIMDNMANVALFHADGAYDQALGTAFRDRFRSLGGTIAVDQLLQSDAQSFAGNVTTNQLATVDAQVLAAPTRAAAVLVNEVRLLEPRQTRWYLSPLLKTQLLLENVAPRALEGATGVTPRIDKMTDFPTAFARRWSGEQPLDGAYFYYDAMALLAFGLERTELVDGRFPAAALRAAITLSTGNRGEAGTWNELPVSLKRLRDQVDMHYSGLTGPILLGSCGDRRSGESSAWFVHDGQIQN
jgi:ABC-type branched-subunit amino acid transport system substrate-binding protein